MPDSVSIDANERETCVTFRPRGWGRFALAAFLLLWLSGWAAFEWLALRFLADLSSKPVDAWVRAAAHPVTWPIAALAILWFALWTFGGVSGIAALARLLFGADQLTVRPAKWMLSKKIGPFALNWNFAKRDIRELYVRRGHAELMIEAEGIRRVVTRLGTPEDRREIARRFAVSPDESLPQRWIAIDDADGITCIARRHVEGPGCLVFLGLMAIAIALYALRFRTELPRWAVAATVAIAIAFTAQFLWGVFSRREFLVSNNRVGRRVRWFLYSSVTWFDEQSLHVDYDRDSDGDERISLRAAVHGKPATLYSDVNEDRDVVGLARYIESRCGWLIPLPASLDVSARRPA